LVAGRVGVSATVLLSWERGTTRPSWAQARALGTALTVPVAEIFTSMGLEPPRHLNRATWQLEDLPDVLFELRRWNGLTQQEWADLAGVTAGTVRAWERGRQGPGRAALLRLDAALGGILRALVRAERPSFTVTEAASMACCSAAS
jgi:transcriptional regulator with XRE-family HTH domain